MSSIPNSAMPHAQSALPVSTGDRSAIDRIVSQARAVPTSAWMAGAAALGVAAAAAAATLWERPQPKKKASTPRRAPRKTASASRRRTTTATA
ncbi:hypothetical protein HL653_18435 [Sphingomonas sp. AP4-R1]|uniref:hypothetical protein n=1 Tax=Sphingomonas sp. AP4-R1 TaxID=2735134 RepID=UPI0014938CDC|nr:hypothetical protein [Sphingomonas sp. AP4-R1]QJU59466.1 hypothetical protein HL653_18435 [Sphingomonas sp. AP4-R1]